MSSTLREGTQVLVPINDRDNTYVEGVICGLSHNPIPVLGQGYIVKLDKALSDFYPYSCVVCFEKNLKVIHDVGV